VVELQRDEQRLQSTRARADAAARTAASARRALSMRVRAAYEGAVPAIGVVLGARTPQGLSDRVEFLGVIAASDAQLADRATQARRQALVVAREQAAAVRKSTTAVAALRSKRHELLSVVGQQEQLISELGT